MRKFWTKVGCFLTGWNADILETCTEASRKQLKKYTSALLILMILWAFIGWSFANKEDGFSYDYDNFEVRGRFGVGISVLDKIYVNAFYDVCKKKFIDDNSYHNNRGNIVTVGIGYTF